MCRLFLVTVACLAILFGITGLYMMPKLIQTKIEEKIQLKIGTKNFERFTKVPIPIRVKFYFFNVTNAEQVLAGLERPHFQEVGPFMFEQWRRRSIVDIVDNNRKITYKEYKTYYSKWPMRPLNVSADWLREQPLMQYLDEQQQQQSDATNGQTEDATNDKQRAYMLNPYAHNVTIVNVPLLSMLTKLADLEESSFKRNVASKIISRLIKEGREKILITRPVNELLFDGYKVGVLEAVRELVSTQLGYNFESPLPANKFGFFHGKNGTWKRDEAGELTIYTGRNGSMDDFMLIDTWNGLKELNTWPKNTPAGNGCNQIKGTDGSQFHPGVTRDHVLGIFSPMICTSLQVKYREDTSCRDIPLLRFTTTPEMFAAPKKVARNACYCTIKEPAHRSFEEFSRYLSSSSNGTASTNNHSPATTTTTTSRPLNGKARITNARCYIDGLIDLSLCQKGAPVAASGPHFYNGDPLLAMAAGLKPQKHRHETYMDIEPMTGAVMRAASRAQLNAFVEQAALDVVDPQLIGHMTPMVAPMLWLEEAAEIDEKSSADFKRQLLNTVHKTKRTFVYTTLFGILLLIVLAVQFWYAECYRLEGKLAAKREEARRKKAEALADVRRSRSLNSRRQRSRSRSSSGGGAGRRRQANARRREQMRDAVGARRSNLAQMALTGSHKPLVDLELEHNDHHDDVSQLVKTAASAVAVASVLGAADAAATRNQRRANRTRRSLEQDEPLDDDELSRRGLVDNEWCQPDRATTTTTGSSSAGGQDEPDAQEPSTSNGLLGDERRPDSPANSSSVYSD